MTDDKTLYKNFWKKSSDDRYYVSKPYTEKDVKRVERKLGYTIPQSYIDLICIKRYDMSSLIQPTA